jgi:hypothetical protein
VQCPQLPRPSQLFRLDNLERRNALVLGELAGDVLLSKVKRSAVGEGTKVKLFRERC